MSVDFKDELRKLYQVACEYEQTDTPILSAALNTARVALKSADQPVDWLKDKTLSISDSDLTLLAQSLMATLLHPKCKDDAVLIQRALSRLYCAEEQNRQIRHDIEAYRGAFGYSVPGHHNGRLSNGEMPQCGLCDARVNVREMVSLKEMGVNIYNADALVYASHEEWCLALAKAVLDSLGVKYE